MPFKVKNGKLGVGKIIKPGVEFPLKVGNIDLAVLAVEKDKTNEVHVTNLVGRDLSVQSGPGFRNSHHENFVGRNEDCLICHAPTKTVFIVIFEEDPIVLEE